MLIVGYDSHGMERVGFDWINQGSYRWYYPTREWDYDKENPEDVNWGESFLSWSWCTNPRVA